MKPIAVRITTSCPHCHEEVSIVITKKDAEQIWKGFKQDVDTATREGDRYLLKKERRQQ